MNVLGISAYYHDSAASMLVNGEIVATVQEERFSRLKHDASFPWLACKYCLSMLQGKTTEIDAVAFYDNFYLKRERAIINANRFDAAVQSFVSSTLNWSKLPNFIANIRKLLGWSHSDVINKTYCVQHHLSHAASAFYCSGLNDSAIVTMDGVGEHATSSIGFGNGEGITITHTIDFPHSIGLFYSAITNYLGFKVNSGEYKVMGLAPLGNPKYFNLLMDEVITLRDDGSFALNLDYFRFHLEKRMIDEEKFSSLVGFGPRIEKDELGKEHKDLAASAQEIVYKALLNIMKVSVRNADSRNVCLAGGVALNCSALGKIRNLEYFDSIYIQPAAGDAGGALGAAFSVYRELRGSNTTNNQFSIYSGPEVDVLAAKSLFRSRGFPYKEYIEKDNLSKDIANFLAQGKVVGCCHGRMEWGPRALGNRSILASPMVKDIHSDLNLRVKKRESFRPFAPAILVEYTESMFVNPVSSPHMSFVMFLLDKLRDDNAKFCFDGNELSVEGTRMIKDAVIHRDWSARVQTVSKDDNYFLYKIIDEFYKCTGCPIVINTSFNVRGEPIVLDYWDAYKCFYRSQLDVLVFGNIVLELVRQPIFPTNELEVFDSD